MNRKTRRPAPPLSGADDRALLNAVLAHPDEDTPRLAFADWLDEQGDAGHAARAEFIRLQVRRAYTLVGEGPAVEREHQLRFQFGDQWKAGCPVLGGVVWHAFFRGFPQVKVSSGAKLAEHAEAIWVASPVEWVELRTFTAAGAAALAACPHLARVRVLGLGSYDAGRAGTGPLRTLLASEHIGGLRELRWTENPQGNRDEGAKLIAQCPRLSNLEMLVLGWEAGVSQDTALQLARSPHLPKLTRFRLNTSGYRRDTVRELKTRFPDLWN